MGTLLKVSDHLRIGLHGVAQEVAIADFAQLPHLLLGSETGEIVDLFFMDADEIRSRRLRERGLRREGAPPSFLGRRTFRGVPLPAANEPVGAEGLLIEEDSLPEPPGGVGRSVVELKELVGVDAQIGQNALGDIAPVFPSFDRLRPAVADQGSASELELVALGVAAEVVMIVEHQNARVRARGLPKEIRGSEPADAAADHDQVIHFTVFDDTLRPHAAVAELVGDFPGAVVRSSQSGQCGRIVGGLPLPKSSGIEPWMEE